MITQEQPKTKETPKYSRPSCLLWALKKLWGVDRRLVFLVFACVPLNILIPLANSLFVKELIDSIGVRQPFVRLAALTIAFLLGITAMKLLNSFIHARRFARHYYPTTIYQTEMGVLEKYKTDYENTEKQDFQKISGYAWRDACGGNCALEYVFEDVITTLQNALGLVTYASLMLTLHPIIFAVVAAVAFLSYFTTRWRNVYYEKHKDKWEKEIRKKGYLQSLSRDFSRAKDIKLYALDGWLDKMMRDYQSYILMWNKRCSLRGLWASIFAAVMTLIQNCTAYMVLIGLLIEGSITVGEFVFFFASVDRIAGFLQGIIGDIAKLNTRAEKIAYYREFYDYPNNFNHGEGCPLPAGPVTVELRDVWYKYDGAEDYTLKGLNLTIEAEQSLALVGMNGAGKTTLIKLICGLYAPTKGEILVGGRRIEEYNIEDYYSLISAVFQENRTIAFTILEYVTSADLNRATAREDAIAALKSAGIYDKVMNLSNGIDTHLMKGIYDDGVEFSGGEMQKLLLARAIYKNGPLLVLDEPTAALDPIAENNLYLQYRDLTRGKTSIYISHRFASTRFCDRIVLLEDGVITEDGTHEELMEKNGQYAYMFGVQSKYYKEGEIHG